MKIQIKTNLVKHKIDKINNIYELFKKYLYHMKIYSPYVTIDSKKLINNNNDFIISKDVDDLSILNDNQSNIQLFDLNLLNINYSNSFVNNSFFNK